MRDNGIGIDPRHADRVFEVFKRLHVRERYEGTGIGRPSAAVVEQHGGEISVAPAPGGGSEFRFTIADSVPCRTLTRTPCPRRTATRTATPTGRARRPARLPPARPGHELTLRKSQRPVLLTAA